MAKGIEIKDVGLSLKDVDEKQGIVTGYFSVFNNKDSDGDIVMPGAFKKTLQENGPESAKPRILHLLQHDTWKPLAKPHVLKEDDHGLYFESKISHTDYGRDTLLLYRDGVLTEHSIGYQTVKREVIEGPSGTYVDRTTKLIELKLWEGSTVSWGANMEALVTGVKSEMPTEEIYEKLLKKLDALNVAVKGNYTDDTARQLEIQLLQLQTIIKSLAERIKPVETTLPKEPTITVEEAIGLIKQNVKWTKKN